MAPSSRSRRFLAASLTLVAEEEHREDAREDAAGAILGGGAMAAFAGVVLALVLLAWVITAVGLYFLIGRRLPVS